jgi:hypothetical protein
MAAMIELVWRKAGEERCEWTPKVPTIATEKKALPEHFTMVGNHPTIGEHPPSRGGLEEYPPSRGGLGEHPPNKREAASAKMNERYLVGQPIQNPFLPDSNYANDLENQMYFLTPTKG